MPCRCWWTLLLLSPLASAAVTHIDFVDRTDVLEGTPFGGAGPYERITAKAYFAIDPALPANRIIADVTLAPRNETGQVEFSADLYILKPRDSAKGNGTALVEISNRGGKSLLNTFDYGSGARDPQSGTDFGDRFLLEQGFTLVWIGWEFDIPEGDAYKDALRLYAPVATEGGRTITGLVHSEWTGNQTVLTIPLGDRFMRGYAVADANAPGTELTVRDRPEAPPRMLPRTEWSFSDDRHATLKPGFQPGKIYDVVYLAKDPVIAGLGPAAVRDLVSFLKHGGPETLLGDQRQYLKRALGFGISQSGRFLREFLYDGFNADEKGRIVFDGVWAHVAGAGRGSFNRRFAQPSRDGHPFFNVFYPVDIPPFSGRDGLLARAQEGHVVPKIFYSNGSYEYWGRCASLIHTTEDGKSDEPPTPDTRIYFVAGTQHGPGSIPPKRVDAQNLASANDYRPALRALLVAMQAWLKDEHAPPASQIPHIEDRTLAPLSALAFPKIAGVNVPVHKREAQRLDFTTVPPRIVGPPYPTLVPQVNVDGNETGGIRLPDLRVPLASYTGWNLRKGAIGAPEELDSMTGSWIPFPRTAVERQDRKDPRLSIEERYPSKRDYLEKITTAAQQLVREGFLLDRDVTRLRDSAAREWDYALRSN